MEIIEDAIKNDFQQQFERSELEEIELLTIYGNDAQEIDDYYPERRRFFSWAEIS